METTESKFIGIDLHSNNFSVCALLPEGKREKEMFKLNRAEVLCFIDKYLDEKTYVMVEASTNTFKFVETIREHAKEVLVANTHKLKLISLVKKKTDKIDAEKLAVFLKMQITSGEELIKPVYVPEETIQDLRSLFTTYKLVLKQKGQVKNRIHSLLKQNLKPFTKEYIFGKKNREKILNLKMSDNLRFQISLLFNKLEDIEEEWKQIKDQLWKIGAEYYDQIDILTSMKGMSIITALAIIADIATVERFPNSKHFTSYLRSAPGVDSSNDETRTLKTNKFSRKLSISFLSQSLNHFRDADKRKQKWYVKLNYNKPKKGIARMALCRKTFSEIYQMLKTKKYHYYRDPQKHIKKMEEYDKFLVKNGIFLKEAS